MKWPLALAIGPFLNFVKLGAKLVIFKANLVIVLIL